MGFFHGHIWVCIVMQYSGIGGNDSIAGLWLSGEVRLSMERKHLQGRVLPDKGVKNRKIIRAILQEMVDLLGWYRLAGCENVN
jgi:hypothetical protein